MALFYRSNLEAAVKSLVESLDQQNIRFPDGSFTARNACMVMRDSECKSVQTMLEHAVDFELLAMKYERDQIRFYRPDEPSYRSMLPIVMPVITVVPSNECLWNQGIAPGDRLRTVRIVRHRKTTTVSWNHFPLPEGPVIQRVARAMFHEHSEKMCKRATVSTYGTTTGSACYWNNECATELFDVIMSCGGRLIP